MSITDQRFFILINFKYYFKNALNIMSVRKFRVKLIMISCKFNFYKKFYKSTYYIFLKKNNFFNFKYFSYFIIFKTFFYLMIIT